MSRHAVRAAVAVAALSLAVLGSPVQAQDTPSAAQEVADLRDRAEAGDATAQYNLGVMYGSGEGVPQDNVEAHMWLHLAASRSFGADRERSVGVRDRVAERMTPADLSEAQRRAREWHAAHPQ